MPAPEYSVKPRSLCRICGAPVKPGGSYCPACAVTFATEQVTKGVPSGWAATQSTQAQAFRAETRLNDAMPPLKKPGARRATHLGSMKKPIGKRSNPSS